MAEILFSIRALIISILIMFVLQFKIGGETLEIKTTRAIYASQAGIQLNEIATGITKLIKEMWQAGLEKTGISKHQK